MSLTCDFIEVLLYLALELYILHASLCGHLLLKLNKLFQVCDFAARVANCALWFLKLPHSEAKEQVIFSVNILGGSSSVLELLEMHFKQTSLLAKRGMKQGKLS